jgi:hypothetical protein
MESDSAIILLHPKLDWKTTVFIHCYLHEGFVLEQSFFESTCVTTSGAIAASST